MKNDASTSLGEKRFLDSQDLAWRIRRGAIEMTHAARASHVGAVLSIADIVAVLYADVLKVDPAQPRLPERDRLILSKGHAGIAVYVALAECGFFPRQDLSGYCSDKSLLSGHVSHKGVPGVEFSTGSLGHGLPVAAGMAMGARRADGSPRNRVFVIMGDGECEEGSVWEAALFCAQHRLGNLTAIVDFNKMQGLGFSDDILSVRPLKEKWSAFGWNVHEVDGHDHDQLKQALESSSEARPTCVLAHTVKGKGVSFMENNLLWHYRDPQDDFYRSAVAELEAARGMR